MGNNMKYEAPVMVQSEEFAEGVFAASGACSYTNARAEKNEYDFNGYKTRFTVKATHVGTTNDRKGAIIYLTFSENVTLEVSDEASIEGAKTGTSFVARYTGSHHSELNVQFTAVSDKNAEVAMPKVKVEVG